MAQSAPFQLIRLPETQKPPVPAQTASGTQPLVNPIAFGRGVLRPFVRDGKGDWANTDDIELVRAEVGQVLGTLASSSITQGELPWRPEFGSLLAMLRFRNLDETTAELARTYVVDALQLWLFRVRVNSASVVLDYDNHALLITVRYDILATNERSVLASNLTETVGVPVAA